MCLALRTASPGEGLKLLLRTTDTPSLHPWAPVCPVNPAGPCLPWYPIPKKPLLHSGPQTLTRRRRVSLDQLPTACPFLPPILPGPRVFPLAPCISCLHAHTKQHRCSMTSKHLAPVLPPHFGAQRKHKITLTFLSFQHLKSLPCESVVFSTLACGSVTAGREERPERALQLEPASLSPGLLFSPNIPEDRCANEWKVFHYLIISICFGHCSGLFQVKSIPLLMQLMLHRGWNGKHFGKVGGCGFNPADTKCTI